MTNIASTGIQDVCGQRRMLGESEDWMKNEDSPICVPWMKDRFANSNGRGGNVQHQE